MTDPVADSLAILVERYASTGQHLLAIKCLKALCSLSLPALHEARARMKCANLMWHHTYNCDEVNKELVKVEVCQAALQLWPQAGPDVNRNELAVWMCHFFMQLASSYSALEQPRDAADILDQGEQFAAQLSPSLHKEQLLFQLCRLQLKVATWAAEPESKKEAEEALQRVHSTLGSYSVDQVDPVLGVFLAQAQVHFRILQMILVIKKGTPHKELDIGKSSSDVPKLLQDLEPYITIIKQQPPAYHWVPANVQAALLYVMTASVMRPRGAAALVTVLLDRGDNEVDGALAQLGVSSATTEQQLYLQNTSDARLLLAVKMLLLEERVMLALRQTNLPTAQHHLLLAVSLVERYPTQLAAMRAHLHLVLALYAHSAGHLSHAEAHCQTLRSLDSSAGASESLKVSATTLQAVAIVASRAAGSVSRAIDVLGHLFTEKELRLGNLEMTSVQYAVGLVHMAQGDLKEAKMYLRKALDKAHDQICHNQHVSQVLNLMAPVYMASGDFQGAVNMVTSSTALAKHTGDMFARTGAKLALLQHESAQQNADLAKIQQQRQQALASLRNLKAAAGSDAQQQQNSAYLLQWGLG